MNYLQKSYTINRMSRKLFGTDGIRGQAGEYPLDVKGAIRIGKAIGAHFTKPGELVLVGYDPRESSPALAKNVIAGLSAKGVTSVLVGTIPTPGLAYLTKHSDARAGVMITASHNPYTDNGVKVFTAQGGKLSDDVEAKLNELIENPIDESGSGSTEDGSFLVQQYEDFLVSTAADVRLDGMSVAVDTANGATSGIAERVFDRLGARVDSLFDKPNGRNINEKCGATDTGVLQQVVKDQNLTAGIALDGDGDRLIMVDEKGHQLDGDYLLYILAMTGGHKAVIATSMSNMGLESSLHKNGITMHRTDVGDRYVLEGLEQTGAQLGGEKSGHIILPAHSTTGDGILAAVQVLKSVRESGKKLTEWFDELILLPQELVNIPLSDKTKLEQVEVKAYIAAQAKELAGQGRVSVRPSGTEPKVRVMVESADAGSRARLIADGLSKYFKGENSHG